MFNIFSLILWNFKKCLKYQSIFKEFFNKIEYRHPGIFLILFVTLNNYCFRIILITFNISYSLIFLIFILAKRESWFHFLDFIIVGAFNKIKDVKVITNEIYTNVVIIKYVLFLYFA